MREFNDFVNFSLFSKNPLEFPVKCGMIISVSTRKERVLTLIFVCIFVKHIRRKSL